MKGVLIAVAAATVLAACATAETSTNGNDKVVERHYRTGSNLPVKTEKTPESDGVTSVSGDDYRNQKDASSSGSGPQMPMPRPGGGR